MTDQVNHSSRHAVARYLVALGAVVTALALRILLTPLTGTGAPFVLFFAAVLVTSLYVGTGPGLAALVTSLPIAAYMFVVRAGYPVHEAAFQALLYAVDGLIGGVAAFAIWHLVGYAFPPVRQVQPAFF